MKLLTISNLVLCLSLFLQLKLCFAQSIRGQLRANNLISLYFTSTQPINAAWVGYRQGHRGMIFLPISFEETDFETSRIGEENSYRYIWHSDLLYNPDETIEFFIQANSDSAIHYAPGPSNTNYYKFEALQTPHFTDVDTPDGTIELSWTPIRDATHYGLRFYSVDEEGVKIPYTEQEVFVPGPHYIYRERGYTPTGFEVRALGKNKVSSPFSSSVISQKVFQQPIKAPKTQVLYVGNAAISIARSQISGGRLSTPLLPSGYAADARGVLATSALLGIVTEPFSLSTHIISTFGDLVGPATIATPQNGQDAFQRPNPEIIPRPGGRILLLVDSTPSNTFEVAFTVNGQPRQITPDWIEITQDNQITYRLNAELNAEEGDDICINLHSTTTNEVFLDNHCQPFIRMVGSLFGEIETFSIPTSQVWSGDVRVTGWFIKDFSGTAAGYPASVHLYHRINANLPNDWEGNLDTLFARPDITQRYGDEFESSVYGFSYTYHVDDFGLNARSPNYLGLRVYDPMSNGRMLYNGTAVVDILP